jgi:hypothetical protein
MTEKYYAGIGSRETPFNILRKMITIAEHLDKAGYTLRSGHAEGADLAFEVGSFHSEIWLPWKSFNENAKDPQQKYVVIDKNDKEAFDSVKFHPASLKMAGPVRTLMARNYRQIIGKDGAPNSEFVVCWTKDGGATGGTGQALRIAAHFDIPIYNLYFPEKYKEVMSL